MFGNKERTMDPKNVIESTEKEILLLFKFHNYCSINIRAENVFQNDACASSDCNQIISYVATKNGLYLVYRGVESKSLLKLLVEEYSPTHGLERTYLYKNVCAHKGFETDYS